MIILSTQDRIRLRHAIEERKKKIEEFREEKEQSDDSSHQHFLEVEIFTLEKEIAYLQRDLERYA